MNTFLLILALVGPADPGGAQPQRQATGAQVQHSFDCTKCHSEEGWQPARFDHEETRLPLRGAHAEQNCRSCHQDVHKLSLDPACAACHVDVHAGRLGQQCQRCHDERSFHSGAGVEAHGQTRFALYGRHAMVPCEKCHQARGDRTYSGAPVDCVACHTLDALRTRGTDVDHTRLGAAPDCRRCHTPVAWARAVYPDHDACFTLSSGPHRGITCSACHTQLHGLGGGTCNTRSAACTHCHVCGNMERIHKVERNVAGYQCADRKCYECHPGGGKQ